jgi:hypothetical protein
MDYSPSSTNISYGTAPVANIGAGFGAMVAIGRGTSVSSTSWTLGAVTKLR